MLLNDGLKKFKFYLELQERSIRTVKDYSNQIQLLNNYLEMEYNCPIYVQDIVENDIENYFRFNTNKRWKSNTRNKALYVFRSFFGFLERKGYIKYNPVARITPLKISNTERVYLTHEEVKELFEAIDHPISRVIAQTMYYGGLRIMECLEIRLNEVDLKKNILTIRKGKGNKLRQVPINKTLHNVLTEYLSTIRPNVPSDRFFASNKSGRISDAYFRRKFNKALDKLNWNTKITPHTLRHSFASGLVKKDVNLFKIQRLLGHTSINTTSIYAHTRIDDLIDAVKMLEEEA